MLSNPRTALSILLLFSLPLLSRAQEFGGNPPSLRWRQVKTDSIRVIFPEGLESVALRIAALSGQMGPSQYTIGNRFRTINVVLQNQTTISNAYVGLAPRRSEFYMTPQQNSFELGSLPWYQQLAQHELRHVQQFNNFNKGISRLFYFLAGELGLSFINSTAIPNWFWEGDAVYSETHLSTQGRGRLPFFFNGYRSLWASSKNYSWLKLRNGSLRDYVPDHYQLGYQLAAYGREKYGADIWAKVTDEAVRFKGLFYPFQTAFKRQTGVSYKQFHREALDYFKKKSNEKPAGSIGWAQQQKHFVANEEFPQWTDPQHLLFVKTSYRQIPHFVVRDIKTGEEKSIRVKDISLDNYFSAKNGNIVYAAMGFDARWGWRNFSELRVLNLETGQQRKLTTRTKYFSPDISEDGKSIVAVEVATNGNSSLHLLEADSGKLIKALPNPNNYYFTYPKFLGNDKVVAAVRNETGEMALGLFPVTGTEVEWLVPFTPNVIGFTQVKGDTISFTASNGESDKNFIYINKQLYQVRVGESVGSYQLTVHDNKMAWVDFTAAGFHLMNDTIRSENLMPVTVPVYNQPLPDFGIRSLATNAPYDPKVNPASKDIQRYRKGSHLINFHSWLPSFGSTENSVTFITENVLNTFQGEASYTNNSLEHSNKISMIGAFGGLYPWIRLGVGYTFGRTVIVNGEKVHWNEAEARTGVLIPFNFSGGRTYTTLRIGTDYVYTKPFIKGAYQDVLDDRSYGYTNSTITFSNQIQQARQHIYPRFAQTFKLDFNYGITNITGNQLLLNGSWYFPGLFTNHNFVINTAFQTRDTARNIIFTNSFPFSRGYNLRSFHNMGKVGFNYHFPLFYPDWGFGSIIYFQRIRANLFYDHTRIMTYDADRKSVTLDYRSYGTEIFFDTKWWNQQPISFGIRYSHLQDANVQGIGPNQLEFVVPVSIINR